MLHPTWNTNASLKLKIREKTLQQLNKSSKGTKDVYRCEQLSLLEMSLEELAKYLTHKNKK